MTDAVVTVLIAKLRALADRPHPLMLDEAREHAVAMRNAADWLERLQGLREEWKANNQ